MTSRSDRYKQRKNRLRSFKDKSHLKELSNSDSVKKLLYEKIDNNFINSVLDKNRPTYNLEVSESEISESLTVFVNKVVRFFVFRFQLYAILGQSHHLR